MKSKLTEWLVKPYLNESPDLDIKVGDDIIMGRFKNKRVKVKSITYNEKGDLLINGRPALKFRKVKNKKKLLPSKTTNKSSAEPDADRKGVDDEYPHFKEAKRVPRKKGQHRGSSSHSDLYTDENPKGTIKGLKFATVDDAKKSVSKIRNSGKTHAHKIQAAVAMEQRAREMGKTSQAAVYRAYINQMKKKTKKKNEMTGLPSPSRKMINKMKKKGNTSVPYGSGYEKVEEGMLYEYSKFRLVIPSDIKKIHKLFKKNKKKLFVVGGAVRDAILGKNPKDFDLATDAKPDEVLAIAKKGGLKTVEVGKQFGVVIVGGHEIATFRKDIGKGRRPSSVDYTDIEGDVKRRDLTINALFYDLDRGEIVDLVGGIKDLKRIKIRTV